MWVFRSVYLLQSSLLATNYTFIPFNGSWSDLTGTLLRPETSKNNAIAAGSEGGSTCYWVSIEPVLHGAEGSGLQEAPAAAGGTKSMTWLRTVIKILLAFCKNSVLAALPQQMAAFHVYNLVCRKTWGFLNAKLIHLPSEESGQHCWDLETYLAFCDGGGSISGVDGIICLSRHLTENAVLLSNH